MAARLIHYISATGDLPFVWGVRDCTLWVADWCILHFGFDPAVSVRGQYSTARGANRIVGDDLIAAIMPFMGCLTVKASPDSGDVGVIDVVGRRVAAIYSQPFWIIKTQTTVAFLRVNSRIVWGNV